MKRSDSNLELFHTENMLLCEENYGERTKQFLIIKSEMLSGNEDEKVVLTVIISDNEDIDLGGNVFTLNDIQLKQLIGFLQSHIND